MEYTAFEKYPLQILGIDNSYNDELTAIEGVVVSEIAYTGDASDIASVLPYFVYCAFVESRMSDTTAAAGEQQRTAEFTLPSFNALVRAWNMAVKALNVICAANEQTASDEYTSPISLW
jgi:hypothetical protein